MSRAQIASFSRFAAQLRRRPADRDIDDPVASLDIDFTDDEVTEPERPDTPRHDFKGVSDHDALARTSTRLGIRPAGP